MKNFIIFLIMLNIGVWVYFNQNKLFGDGDHANTEEIMPDDMQLLTPHQLSKLPLVSESESSQTKMSDENIITATLCFEWGIFSSSNIKKAQSALDKLTLKGVTKEHSSKEAKRYWVYLPPLKSAAAAQQKAKSLRASSVNDLFVLQGVKWKNAISFGVFQDEALANQLLKDLRIKGIKHVVKKLRSPGNGNYSLLVKGVSADKAKDLKQAKTKFPATNIKPISCL